MKKEKLEQVVTKRTRSLIFLSMQKAAYDIFKLWLQFI